MKKFNMALNKKGMNMMVIKIVLIAVFIIITVLAVTRGSKVMFP